MATTQNDVRRWLKNAPPGSTHMMVVCDTFSYDDYPVYCTGPKECHEAYNRYKAGENMTKLMEVYDLRMDHEEQVCSERAMNMSWTELAETELFKPLP